MSHTTSAADSFESKIKEECKQLKLHIETLTLKQKNNFLKIMEITLKTMSQNSENELVTIHSNLIDYYFLIAWCCNFIICNSSNDCNYCYSTYLLPNVLFFNSWNKNFEIITYFFKIITSILKTNLNNHDKIADIISNKIITKID